MHFVLLYESERDGDLLGPKEHQGAGSSCHGLLIVARGMVLHRAIQAARAGDLATLRDLASSGHLASAITDAQGAGPVHHAARCGRLDCLQFLVKELGLAAGAQASNGATPAHDAAATGHIQELQWLAHQEGCNIEVSLTATHKESWNAWREATCPALQIISNTSAVHELEFRRDFRWIPE